MDSFSQSPAKGAGLSEFEPSWILDPQLRTLEILELEASAHYRVAVARSRGKVRIPGCPGLVLNLDDLWAEVDEADRQQTARLKKR